MVPRWAKKLSPADRSAERRRCMADHQTEVFVQALATTTLER
jgi:hypothetical protein